MKKRDMLVFRSKRHKNCLHLRSTFCFRNRLDQGCRPKTHNADPRHSKSVHLCKNSTGFKNEDLCMIYTIKFIFCLKSRFFPNFPKSHYYISHRPKSHFGLRISPFRLGS